MEAIYALLVTHFVADFVCQSNWMAANKSKNWGALGLHVLVYSLVLLLVAIPLAGWRPEMAWLFVAVNGVAHFIQDAITSRITSRLWFFRQVPGHYGTVGPQLPYVRLVNPWVAEGGDRHWFFVAIGFDQLLHYATLFVTAGWWLR